MASSSPPPASASASTPTPESWDAPTLLSLLPRLTFTQGLVVGQLSIILVVVALVRYLLFEDHAAGGQGGETTTQGQRGDEANRSFPQDTRRPTATRNASSSLLSLSLSSLAPSLSRAKSPPLPPLNSSDEKAGSGPTLATLARIPDAVGYDMETASDCDVGWLNVLLAHVWEGYRDDFLAGGSRVSSSTDGDAAPRSARTFMQDVLNRRRSSPSPSSPPSGPSFLDPISVSAVHPGSSYPLLSNARVRPRDDAGRVRIEVDVDYTDVVSLDVTTALCLNFPRPRFAVLPVSLGVRITRFSGTLSLCVVSHAPAETGEEKRSRHSLEISLHPDFLLLATCSSLVGSRAKLQDIPKIQQVMLQRIRGAILDKVGWPQAWTVEMPDLVTGRGREPGGEGEGVGEELGEEWEEEDDDGELYDGEGEQEGWEGYEDEMEDELDARYWQQQQQQRYARRPPAQHLNGHAHASRGDIDVNVTPRPRRRAAAPAATTTGAAPRAGGGAGGAGAARRRRPAAAATPPLPSAPSIARPPPSADQLTSISRRPAAQRHHTATTTKSASRNGAIPPRTPPQPPPPLNGVEAWRKEMVRKTRGGTPGAERRLN